MENAKKVALPATTSSAIWRRLASLANSFVDCGTRCRELRDCNQGGTEAEMGGQRSFFVFSTDLRLREAQYIPDGSTTLLSRHRRCEVHRGAS